MEYHLPTSIGKGWPGKWLLTWDGIVEETAPLLFLKTCGRQINEKMGQELIKVHFLTAGLQIQIDGLTKSVLFDQSIDEVLLKNPEKIIDEFIKLKPHFKSELHTIPTGSDSILKTSGRIPTILIPVVQDLRDNRWNNCSLPPTQTILADISKKCGFRVQIHVIPLNIGSDYLIPQTDFLAFSVYEDLFEPLQDFISRIKENSKTIVIAGGPMAIRAPEALITHFPEIDIVIRGDAERSFQEFLTLMKRGSLDDYIHHYPIELGKISGLFIRRPGLIFSLDLHKNETLQVLNYHGIEQPKQFIRNGLELSTSKGCPRSCSFCSHIHGYKYRQRSLSIIEKQLDQYLSLIQSVSCLENADIDRYFRVNINDDDLLLDFFRCSKLLTLLRSKGFRVWGIQTSLDSICSLLERPDDLDFLMAPEFYVEDSPTFWIGTDAFEDARLRRLGKHGKQNSIRQVCEALSKRGILHCHYWIMTDAESDWQVFFQELFLLLELKQKNGAFFRVLPNASTLVPYPSTKIYQQRLHNNLRDRIVIRKMLHIEGIKEFDFPLILHERPKSDYLYALVEPRANVPERLLFDQWGFIKSIRDSRFDDAIFAALKVLKLEISDQRLNEFDKYIASLTGTMEEVSRKIHGYQ